MVASVRAHNIADGFSNPELMKEYRHSRPFAREKPVISKYTKMKCERRNRASERVGDSVR